MINFRILMVVIASLIFLTGCHQEPQIEIVYKYKKKEVKVPVPCNSEPITCNFYSEDGSVVIENLLKCITKQKKVIAACNGKTLPKVVKPEDNNETKERKPVMLKTKPPSDGYVEEIK